MSRCDRASEYTEENTGRENLEGQPGKKQQNMNWKR